MDGSHCLQLWDSAQNERGKEWRKVSPGLHKRQKCRPSILPQSHFQHQVHLDQLSAQESHGAIRVSLPYYISGYISELQRYSFNFNTSAQFCPKFEGRYNQNHWNAFHSQNLLNIFIRISMAWSMGWKPGIAISRFYTNSKKAIKKNRLIDPIHPFVDLCISISEQKWDTPKVVNR